MDDGFGMSMLFVLIFFIAIYIYSSFTYFAIAKKAKHKNPGLAWIPLIGPVLVFSQIAKMHWWPIFLIPFTWALLFPSWVAAIVGIVFSISMVVRYWKTFEIIQKPAWWALFSAGTSFIIALFTFVSLEEELFFKIGIFSYVFPLIFLALLGVAAWSKKK